MCRWVTIYTHGLVFVMFVHMCDCDLGARVLEHGTLGCKFVCVHVAVCVCVHVGAYMYMLMGFV